MKIVTAYFDYPGRNTYARCLRAFKASIVMSNPDAELQILELEPPEPVEGAYQGWVNNHIKLHAYSQIPIDQPTVFVDIDTIFLRDVSELFDKTFDVAIGQRPHWGGRRVRYNGGVVLFKPTQAARRFMAWWSAIDGNMLENQDLHMKWHVKYNGQNQASFGCMMELHSKKTRIHRYPTAVLNACEQDWPRISENVPYILHVRKRLLKAAQSPRPLSTIRKPLQAATKIWRYFETCDQ